MKVDNNKKHIKAAHHARGFMEAHKAGRSIVVTKNITEKRKMGNKEIAMIPARVLLAGMG